MTNNLKNNKYISNLTIKNIVDEFVENDPEAQVLMDEQRLINSISNEIIRIRKSKELTQADLAEKINTRQASISRLEKGNLNKLPTIEFLYKIANALNKKLIIKFE
ncbi:MAG: helix-turn-helix transcriptional regulator [Endomicrobium sp.]|jgi:DNA-binding XRE family transcriptional regulator|nr:helix-turn-helix transcriptional regulator [Endomicrobium sp.]